MDCSGNTSTVLLNIDRGSLQNMERPHDIQLEASLHISESYFTANLAPALLL